MKNMLRISSIWFCLFALTGRAIPAAEPAEFLEDIRHAVATIITYDGNKNILNKGAELE